MLQLAVHQTLSRREGNIPSEASPYMYDYLEAQVVLYTISDPIAPCFISPIIHAILYQGLQHDFIRS